MVVEIDFGKSYVFKNNNIKFSDLTEITGLLGKLGIKYNVKQVDFECVTKRMFFGKEMVEMKEGAWILTLEGGVGIPGFNTFLHFDKDFKFLSHGIYENE